jgi:CheY-like chemotaxis protein
MNGRNGSGYYQDAYEPQPMAAVREDAPARIYCFIEDMFFLAKIQETARKLGVKVEFVKGGDKDAVVATLTELPETERPKLLVFDLNNLNAKPLTLIPKFKAKLKKATSIVGFLNHLQGELKAKAIEAGCDTVMPRSAFSQSLPNLLRRYGLEEEEEYAQQPA